MKKFLGILILILFWCSFSTAEVEKVLKEIKKNKDIARGFNNVKEYDQRNKWRIANKKILKSDKSSRQHILKIVNKKDGFPTRYGDQSIRFEVRDGDSWGWDSRNDRERVELIICCFEKKTHWNTWSIYLPNDFPVIFPTKVAMGQFHGSGDNPPEFMFQNQFDKYSKSKSGGYWVTPAESISDHVSKKLLDQKDMLGKWNDILINAKWTHKDDGFFKIWINGELIYEHRGKTHLKGEEIEHQLGIYRSYVSRSPGPDPTQIVFYDEIRYAKTCKKLKLKDLGYSCKEIENQSLN